MYKRSWLMLLFVSLVIMFISCEDDQVLDGFLNGDNENSEIIDPDPEQDSEDPYNVITDAVAIPCDYDFTTTQVNASLNISCDYDLKGQRISLPDGVKLNFDGGKITNGSLVFSSNGVIDGQLLNIDLEVTGDLAIEHPHFIFVPSRWNIVQGKTTDDKAFQNKEHLNTAIELTHDLGMEVFEIDKLDAYFFGRRLTSHAPFSYEDNAIKVPSNTHFLMSDNTFIRVQPSNNPFSRLLMTYKAQNVLIEGGNLVGDRYLHDYSNVTDETGVSRATHGYGSLINIAGSQHVTVDNVNIYEGEGDGVLIQISAIRNKDGSIKAGEMESSNVVIKNSLIDKCRRNNFSIIDANGVLIENNVISNAGGEHESGQAYAGTAPEVGIDLEAYRERRSDGSLYEYERVTNVTIRNNEFVGNDVADVIVYTASFVDIIGNTFDNRVGVHAGHDVKIANNEFTAGERITTQIAVSFDNFIVNETEHLTYNIDVTGNTISGYDTAMKVGTQNVTVSENKIYDFVTGINITDIENAQISNNTLESKRGVSYGYFSRGNSIAKNVTIKGDKISVQHRPIYLNDLNQRLTGSVDKLLFDNCTFLSDRELYIYNSKNITIQNSEMSERVEAVNSQNIVLTNNQIL